MFADPTQASGRPSERTDDDGAAGSAVDALVGFGSWGHDPHVHEFHQLIYVPVGHAVVWAEGHTHHLSGSVALFVPARVWHAARFEEECLVLPVEIDVERHRPERSGCVEVAMTPFRRRVLHRHLREQLDDQEDQAELCAALLGGTARLALPEPRSAVARAVAQSLQGEPESQRTVSEWASLHYVSATSLSRAFRAETGLTFSQWRTRARLNASLDLLAEGQLISIVAQRVGFSSANGFILAFRRHLGRTPKAFIDAGGAVA